MPSVQVVLSPTGMVIDSSEGLNNVRDTLCTTGTVVSFITSLGTIKTITKKYDWDVRCAKCMFKSRVCPHDSRYMQMCSPKSQVAPSVYYSCLEDILEEL